MHQECGNRSSIFRAASKLLREGMDNPDSRASLRRIPTFECQHIAGNIYALSNILAISGLDRVFQILLDKSQ